jgi:hypothetical protein
MLSKSMFTSISLGSSTGVEDPPGITQRSWRPSVTPPAKRSSKTSWRRVIFPIPVS